MASAARSVGTVWDLQSAEVFFLAADEFFIYLFYHDFATIYGPSEILQNYTSAAAAHGVRDITPGGRSRQEWAHTLNAEGHDVKYLTPRAMALGA
jgi:hypothetical protein